MTPIELERIKIDFYKKFCKKDSQGHHWKYWVKPTEVLIFIATTIDEAVKKEQVECKCIARNCKADPTKS